MKRYLAFLLSLFLSAALITSRSETSLIDIDSDWQAYSFCASEKKIFIGGYISISEGETSAFVASINSDSTIDWEQTSTTDPALASSSLIRQITLLKDNVTVVLAIDKEANLSHLITYDQNGSSHVLTSIDKDILFIAPFNDTILCSYMSIPYAETTLVCFDLFGHRLWSKSITKGIQFHDSTVIDNCLYLTGVSFDEYQDNPRGILYRIENNTISEIYSSGRYSVFNAMASSLGDLMLVGCTQPMSATPEEVFLVNYQTKNTSFIEKTHPFNSAISGEIQCCYYDEVTSNYLFTYRTRKQIGSIWICRAKSNGSIILEQPLYLSSNSRAIASTIINDHELIVSCRNTISDEYSIVVIHIKNE